MFTNVCDICIKQFMPTPITEPTGGVASGDGSLEYALSGLLFTFCIVQTGSGAGWSHNTLYLHVVSSKIPPTIDWGFVKQRQ